MGSRRVVRYSEAFRLQVVEEIEAGKFGSAHEAALSYGIGSSDTVMNWLRRYGRWEHASKVVRVEKPGEMSENKKLRDRVRKLEEALADVHIDRALDRAYFEMLCEQTGVSPEEFKKKRGGTRSTRSETVSNGDSG